MAKKLKPYKIVSADTPDKLEKRVINKMKDGWVPIGGVTNGDDGFVQALIPGADAAK